MSRNTEYNSMKVSKERTSFGHIRYQSSTIKITPDNICMRGQEICFFNATSTCHSCALLTADTRLDILFRPSPFKPPISDIAKLPEKLSLSEDDQAKKFRTPPLPIEEPKVVPTEEELDEPHFVKHICESITHIHSGNLKDHTHYFTNNICLNNCCYVCGIIVVGNTMCPGCEQIHFEE